jgi:hypothetical protein
MPLPVLSPYISTKLKYVSTYADSCVSVQDYLLRVFYPPAGVLELIKAIKIINGN